MSNNTQALVPKITKMAKYLMALKTNNDKLTGSHHRILHILREMNTTVQIISGLTGIKDDKVRTFVNELHTWGLASIVEVRKGTGRQRNIWGMHDEFRAVHKVPTYPSVHQEAMLSVGVRKGARKLDMDETAAILWGDSSAARTGHSEALVEIATSLKKTPILSIQAGDAEARRICEETTDTQDWDINNFLGDDE